MRQGLIGQWCKTIQLLEIKFNNPSVILNRDSFKYFIYIIHSKYTIDLQRTKIVCLYFAIENKILLIWVLFNTIRSIAKTQTCYPPVGIVYNPKPLPLLSGSTVLLTDEHSLPNCSLNHLPIGCPFMASASLDLSFGSFTTWNPAFSVLNFRLCSSE